jgi:mono/diheme cytochrome c family protein
VVWALTRGPDAVALSDPSDAARVADGAAIYAGHCADCHGAALEGHPDWDTHSGPGPAPAPPHDATGHTWHHGDRMLFDYVKRGGAAVAADLGVAGFQSGMPAYADILSDAEIGAVLAYIKTHWPDRLAEYQREVTAAE